MKRENLNGKGVLKNALRHSFKNNRILLFLNCVHLNPTQVKEHPEISLQDRENGCLDWLI